MESPLRVEALSATWRFALVGAIASLPVTAVLNLLPDSEATVGGGVMIFGAFIGGAIAAVRSSDPDDVGIRAGFVGAILGLLVFLLTEGTTVTWGLPKAVFFVFGGGLMVFVASLFGMGFGRVGGWTADAVVSRWTNGTDAS
ncbi:DUF5518 domain-containing protein [Natronoarchaeum mannanilyticum]|uniref:DUF5518 domain-containing protein n=1 Tax=Natronoarchaeum mannanilyticum TaxID=926360 RepID=A0AAV3TBH1_9EURY